MGLGNIEKWREGSTPSSLTKLKTNNSKTMREIKFRFWDKNGIQKGMSKPTTLKEIGHNIGNYFNPNWIVMQFTGLTDKNGTEIYEGDIIRYYEHAGYLISDFTAVVGFENGAFGYKKTDGFIDILESFCSHDCLEDDFLSYVEVIGNIHENPELLKQK